MKGAASPDKGVELPVIERTFWQVESEMAGNGRSVAIDLGKLVCGCSANKLLIVRLPVEGKSAPISAVNQFILEAAEFCSGNLFVAFLPVYATGHKHLEEYWMNTNVSLPFQLFIRDSTDEKWIMRKLA